MTSTERTDPPFPRRVVNVNGVFGVFAPLSHTAPSHKSCLWGVREGPALRASGAGLQGVTLPFAGTHPHEPVEIVRPNLAVTDLAGAGGRRDMSTTLSTWAVSTSTSTFTLGTNSTLYSVRATLGLAALAAIALHLGDGDPDDPGAPKGLLHSSSLKGLMMAVTRCGHVDPPGSGQ